MTKLFLTLIAVCTQLLQTSAEHAYCILQGQNLTLNIYITLLSNVS